MGSRLSRHGLLYLVFAATLAGGFSPVQTWAEAPGVALGRARDLAAAGQGAAAYDLLWQAVLEEPTHLGLNFELGRLAMELGLYENAAATFERILMLDPNQPRSRYELAKAYFELKAYALAEEEFQKVLAAQPPPEVQQAVARYLDELAARQSRHQLEFSGQLGLTYDTNANAGPGAGVVTTSLGPVPVTAEGGPQADWGTVLGLALDHRYALAGGDSWVWQSHGGVNSTLYHDKHAFDLAILSLATGPAQVIPDRRLEMAVTVDAITYGSDDYAQFYGLAPAGTWRLASSLFLNGEAALQKRAYSADDDRDGTYGSIQVTPRLFWGDNRYMVQWRLGWAREDARAGHKSWDGPEAAIGLYSHLVADLTGYLQLGFQDVRYDAQDPSFPELQADKRYRALASLASPLPWWDLAASLAFQYTRNTSTLDVYDYTRRQTTLLLTRRF
ncbi:MAG: porin family protein [Thermodesulfobacteriota bacterium]